ncbi:lipopolysaccharide biosynthesis protein [Cellulomonas endophytica]|uniref:lipopolysaccharide biosynthesis protein n=1 Tax=Cellulomonas endophytica TaxID=2494735 RepID=UPI0010119629|nr:lipopolysaccharide biosynthesis protein [Cellulomonas endophytica]
MTSDPEDRPDGGDLLAATPGTAAPVAPAEPAAPAGPAAADDVDRGPEGDLKSHALSSVKWNFLASVASLLGRLVFTFVLARLIGPENFGIFSMATLYTTFAVVVLDQGFGLALIQRKELRPTDVASVAWLNFAMGTTLAVATLVAAPAIADFFGTPELTAVLRVLSIALFLRGITLVRENLVRRHLRFREFAQLQAAGVLAGGVAGVVAALLGAEYWSLVVQILVNDVVIAVGLVMLARDVSWRGSWRSLRDMASFSSKMLVTQVMIYIGGNVDNILIGRVTSPAQLAFYALSYRLLRMPIQMIGSVVNGVALPIFARLQDDDERTTSWFLTATQAVAVVAFPLFGVMVIGAEAGVSVAFGDEWQGAVVPLQVLALAGIPMIVRMLLSPLATARGEAGLVLFWSTLGVCLQIVGIVVGLWLGGIVGVAAAVTVTAYATWLPNVAHVLRRTVGLGLDRYVVMLLPPAASTVLAVGVWWAAYTPFRPAEGEAHLAVAFVGVSVLALAVYGAAMRLLFPRTFAAVVGVGSQVARRQTGA